MSEKDLRRWLSQEGYKLKKGRQAVGGEGYMIIDKEHDACIAGSEYSMNIDDVEAWAWTNL